MKCSRCVRCCLETRMELSMEDIQRLKARGFSRKEFSEEGEDGILRLRNVKGACFFLVKLEKRCRAYSFRPRGCAIYPVNITEDGEIVVDDECPRASTITDAELKRKGEELRRLISRIDAEADSRRFPSEG